MRLILVVCSFFLFNAAFAQTSQQSVGDVVIHKDPRLDLLVKKQIQVNEESARMNRRTMKGYRLLVINTNSRDEAIAAKTQVYTYFPELKSYLLYQTPFFKLKAGNFKTRDEADDYRQKLNVIFPKGVFIMNDIIEVKPELNEEF